VNTRLYKVTVAARVISCFAHLSGRDKSAVIPESTFDQLDMDSLDVIELIMALEEEFEIEIDENLTGDFTTVGEFIALVEKETAGTVQGSPI